MIDTAILRHYALKDGQRWGYHEGFDRLTIEEHWPEVHLYHRERIERVFAREGIPFPEKPVVLCWERGELEIDSDTRPVIWPAWSDPSDQLTLDLGPSSHIVFTLPDWAFRPNGMLMLVDSRAAAWAASFWPSGRWYEYWHPTARLHRAAREVGVTALLVGGRLDGTTQRIETALPRLVVPTAPPVGVIETPDGPLPRWGEDVYNRDPEPTAIAGDGSCLWCYRLTT